MAVAGVSSSMSMTVFAPVPYLTLRMFCACTVLPYTYCCWESERKHCLQLRLCLLRVCAGCTQVHYLCCNAFAVTVCDAANIDLLEQQSCITITKTMMMMHCLVRTNSQK